MSEQEIIKKVAELKDKHNLSKITVLSVAPRDIDGEPIELLRKHVFLRPVTRQTLAAALATSDKVEQTVRIYNACWLEGDKTMLDDMDYFPGLLLESSNLIPETVTTVKNY